jgi:hypothetical protein
VTDVVPVPCPYCHQALYLAERREEAGRTMWVAGAGTPQVKSDAEGSYVTCQHCFRRISVAIARESRDGVVLEITE